MDTRSKWLRTALQPLPSSTKHLVMTRTAFPRPRPLARLVMATLATVIASAAHAAPQPNGTSFNGTSFNGTSFNGTSFNGTALNGTGLKTSTAAGSRAEAPGDALNGISLKGARVAVRPIR